MSMRVSSTSLIVLAEIIAANVDYIVGESRSRTSPQSCRSEIVVDFKQMK